VNWGNGPVSQRIQKQEFQVGERKREKSFEYPISPERGRGRAEPGGGGIQGTFSIFPNTRG